MEVGLVVESIFNKKTLPLVKRQRLFEVIQLYAEGSAKPSASNRFFIASCTSKYTSQ
jgi:hypothetical protein